MVFRTLLAAAVVAATASIVHAQSPAPSITMNEKSAVYTVTWRGAPDKAVVRYKLFSNKGQIFVCGNFAISGHSNQRINIQSLRDLEIRMDKRTTLLKDLTNFNRVRSERQLVGSEANCFASGVAAPRDSSKHSFGVYSRKNVYQD